MKRSLRNIKCIFMLCYCVTVVVPFNVDTKHPIVLSGTEGSYFGYAVALHKNKDGPLALVTAPKGNSSFYGAQINEPGVLYKCPTEEGTLEKCKVVQLDRPGNSFTSQGPADYWYHDFKDGMWLGVSLDVQPEPPHHVVTCGHKWKNQIYDGHYLANGVCYIINQNLEMKSRAKLIPLVEKRKQSIIPPGIYLYALGQAGMSAAFSENGEDLLLGAPGVHDWIGTVVEYKVQHFLAGMGNPVVPRVASGLNPDPESYIGYSVTSGHFFESLGLSYVTGAPRDAANNGRVYVFEKLGFAKNKFVVQQKMEGEQLGEYFGGSVLGVNIDSEDYTLLLVGAPLYSTKQGGGDEGRVYVFHSDGTTLQLQKDLFMGGKKHAARFGSAMAAIGDINQDQFNDVAIGAPYEDDGQGAIYIHHGMKNGLKPGFSQRIGAKELNKGLRGFGISIARSMDIDDNQYPDLLVGAYSSDQAVIFKTRPVVQVTAKLEFNVAQIDVNGTKCPTRDNKKLPCFKVAACMSYTGKHVSDFMDFLVELSMDIGESVEGASPSKQQVRGYFALEGGQNDVIRQGVSLQVDKPTCFEREVHIYEDIQDFITPMMFRAKYKLANDEEETSFCPNCPTLDPTLPNEINKEILFRTGCGEDNTCLADLRVRANIVGLPEDEPLIVGGNDSITVNIRVENRGEPAYAATLFVRLPVEVAVVNQAHCHLIDKDETNLNSLECKLGNPMASGTINIFQIKLDISKLDSSVEQILVEMEAGTASEEKNPKDNRHFLRVPFKALADITIKGHADQEQIIYESKAEIIPLLHNFVILKYLPSPVKSVGVAIYIPLMHRETKLPVVHIESIEVGEGRSTVPGFCNISLSDSEQSYSSNDRALEGSKDAPNTINLIDYRASIKKSSGGGEPQNYFSSDSQVREDDGPYAINCISAVCKVLTCQFGPFIDTNKVGTIKLKMKANITALQSAMGNRAKVITEGKVWIRGFSYDPQPEGHRPDEDTASTDLLSELQVKRPLPWWIILVSVLAGLLLVALIILALVKLGFFRRSQKEEMEKMLQKGALISKDDAEPHDGGEEADKDEFDYINFADSTTPR